LSVLVFKGALTLDELATIEQVSPPSMSRTVDELERHELVRRARDKRDRRVVYAVATREGKRLLDQARERRLRLLAEKLNSVSGQDREIIAQACQLLAPMVSK
jgi:DNA-binding MarR family transcriptional regulator